MDISQLYLVRSTGTKILGHDAQGMFMRRAKLSREKTCRGRKPTHAYLQKSLHLLRDFEIFMDLADLPIFETVAQVEQWRCDLIKAKLCG